METIKIIIENKEVIYFFNSNKYTYDNFIQDDIININPNLHETIKEALIKPIEEAKQKEKETQEQKRQEFINKVSLLIPFGYEKVINFNSVSITKNETTIYIKHDIYKARKWEVSFNYNRLKCYTTIETAIKKALEILEQKIKQHEANKKSQEEAKIKEIQLIEDIKPYGLFYSNDWREKQILFKDIKIVDKYKEVKVFANFYREQDNTLKIHNIKIKGITDINKYKLLIDFIEDLNFDVDF